MHLRILIFLLIISLVMACRPPRPDTYLEVRIRPRVSLSPEELNKNSEIIQKRMDAISEWPPEIILPETGPDIHLKVYAEEAPEVIRGLLTQMGTCQFVPTIPAREVWGSIAQEDSAQLSSFSHPGSSFYQFNPTSPVFCLASPADTAQIRERLRQLTAGFPVPFAAGWGREPIATQEGERWELVLTQPKETGIDLLSAPMTSRAELTDYGQMAIYLTFSPSQADRWTQLTTQQVEDHIAILIDGQVYSSPKVIEPITSGRTMISGNFSQSEARFLAVLLRFGPLSAPFDLLFEERKRYQPK